VEDCGELSAVIKEHRGIVEGCNLMDKMHIQYGLMEARVV
jgi:hypothetical protein